MKFWFGNASCNLELTTCIVDRDATENEQYYLITCLYTPKDKRGEGDAGNLLEFCKEYAFDHNLPVRLWAGPFDDYDLDQQELFEFYQRHGFEFYDPSRLSWLEAPISHH